MSNQLTVTLNHVHYQIISVRILFYFMGSKKNRTQKDKILFKKWDITVLPFGQKDHNQIWTPLNSSAIIKLVTFSSIFRSHIP